jgi:hypothetical protein
MNLSDIKKDFPHHQKESDDFYVTKLAQSYRHCEVKNFDFSHTEVSYHSIRELWRSDTIGYYMGNVDHAYNKLVSVIFIEIKGSTAHEQYLSHRRKNTNNGTMVKIFPLPYRNNFLIDDGHNIVSGLKQIILTIDGLRVTN